MAPSKNTTSLVLFEVLVAATVLLGDMTSGMTVRRQYEKRDYFEVRERLDELSALFPDVMTLENAEKHLDVPYLINCDVADEEKCVLDIVRITNKKVSAEEKVQVIITGGMHGTDRLST